MNLRNKSAAATQSSRPPSRRSLRLSGPLREQQRVPVVFGWLLELKTQQNTAHCWDHPVLTHGECLLKTGCGTLVGRDARGKHTLTHFAFSWALILRPGCGLCPCYVLWLGPEIGRLGSRLMAAFPTLSPMRPGVKNRFTGEGLCLVAGFGVSEEVHVLFMFSFFVFVCFWQGTMPVLRLLDWQFRIKNKAGRGRRCADFDIPPSWPWLR